jgi:hypothetical protein
VAPPSINNNVEHDIKNLLPRIYASLRRNERRKAGSAGRNQLRQTLIEAKSRGVKQIQEERHV